MDYLHEAKDYVARMREMSEEKEIDLRDLLDPADESDDAAAPTFSEFEAIRQLVKAAAGRREPDDTRAFWDGIDEEGFRRYGVLCSDCGGTAFVPSGDGCGLCGGLGRRRVGAVISFKDVKAEVDAALPSGAAIEFDYRVSCRDLAERAFASVEDARVALVVRMIHYKRGRESQGRTARWKREGGLR